MSREAGIAGSTAATSVGVVAEPAADVLLASGSNGATGSPARRRRPVRDRLRWVFRRRLCFGGLAGALVFFCLSLAPSLLPRTVAVQGLVSGITTVIGYGLGSVLSAGIRNVIRSEPGRQFKRIAWWVLLGAGVVLVPLFLALGRSWQEDVRDLMGMDSQAPWKWGAIFVVAVLVALSLLVISRSCAGSPASQSDSSTASRRVRCR